MATANVPEIYYPASDGQPMGETGWHVTALHYLLGALRIRYARWPDVYVGSNMFLYYVEGQPSKCKAPDLMVCFGVRGNHERSVFKVWEEGVVPAIVIEVSSRETFREDVDRKSEVYAQLGVAEYFLYDPLGGLLDWPLLGFRLSGSEYEAMPHEDDDGLNSAVLGLRLVPEGSLLRLADPITRELLPTDLETHEQLQEERRRNDALVAEVERLRRLLERRGEDQG